LIGVTGGKVVEGAFGWADHVVGDEVGTFAGPVFGMLEAALPLHHRPAVIAICLQLRKDSPKVHLPIA